MKVAVVLHVDSRSDEALFVHSDVNHAVAFARNLARQESDEINEEMTDDMKDNGWLYYAGLNEDGDYIRVVSLDLIEPILNVDASA